MRLPFDYTFYCTYVVRMLLFLRPALFLRMAIQVTTTFMGSAKMEMQTIMIITVGLENRMIRMLPTRLPKVPMRYQDVDDGDADEYGEDEDALTCQHTLYSGLITRMN